MVTNEVEGSEVEHRIEAYALEIRCVENGLVGGVESTLEVLQGE